MPTPKVETVIQKIVSVALQDRHFRAALRVSPAHAVRQPTWLTRAERRTLAHPHLERLAQLATGLQGTRTPIGTGRATSPGPILLEGRVPSPGSPGPSGVSPNFLSDLGLSAGWLQAGKQG